MQQTDTVANANTPANIATAQTLDGILAQVAQDQKDLPAAIKANKDASTLDEQGVAAVDELLNIDSAAAATVGAASPVSTTGANSKKNGRKGARAFIS